MKSIISTYTVKLPFYYVYMLQQVEYNPNKFILWVQQLFNDNKAITSVMLRKKLVYTPKAVALIIGLYAVVFATLLFSVLLFDSLALIAVNLAVLLISFPSILFLFSVLITFIARVVIVAPKERRMINKSKSVFSNHKGIKIAVIGSYGKTSMKELLATVLSQGKNIATTPGNMNTAVSHARFAQTLTGEEDVLIVEFGEGAPGDIEKMADTLRPDFAIITGLAPNHLDFYASVGAVAKDFLSIYNYVAKEKVYVSSESGHLKNFISDNSVKFSTKEALSWKISAVVASALSTSFIMKKGKKEFRIKTSLLGRHQVAPTALAVAMADSFGLNKQQILEGCKNIQAYEHRMQPRHMHGAWLIDDTYNGNIEGMKAGLRLLGELDMKRKWYITPGLVDQGSESETVHEELGVAIAQINPDIVVLMDNSVRPIIQNAMENHGFSGELRIEKNPLEFYTNIEHIIVSGDLVLMQNDWTDNYN